MNGFCCETSISPLSSKLIISFISVICVQFFPVIIFNFEIYPTANLKTVFKHQAAGGDQKGWFFSVFL
jgi:hypothetical protein